MEFSILAELGFLGWAGLLAGLALVSWCGFRSLRGQSTSPVFWAAGPLAVVVAGVFRSSLILAGVEEAASSVNRGLVLADSVTLFTSLCAALLAALSAALYFPSRERKLPPPDRTVAVLLIGTVLSFIVGAGLMVFLIGMDFGLYGVPMIALTIGSFRVVRARGGRSDLLAVFALAVLSYLAIGWFTFADLQRVALQVQPGQQLIVLAGHFGGSHPHDWWGLAFGLAGLIVVAIPGFLFGKPERAESNMRGVLLAVALLAVLPVVFGFYIFQRSDLGATVQPVPSETGVVSGDAPRGLE